MKTLCLDFDGVIHSYKSGWKGAAEIPDPPVEGALEFIVAATKRFRVAIHSSRSGQEGGIPAMKRWLGHWLISQAAGDGMALVDADKVWGWVENEIDWPTSKPGAFLTIDDRGFCFRGYWPSLDEIDAFKTWQQQVNAGMFKVTEELRTDPNAAP